jgi:replication-associated recombination protein RarA
MTDTDPGWERPIPHFSTDPFHDRLTVHGLPSDAVRSSLHKHVRRGRVEESILSAMELARTDLEHEQEMWRRLRVLAAEDVGLGTPEAISVVAALHDSSLLFAVGSYERLQFAAQAAGYLAWAEKDPTPSEIMQVALHEDRPARIPPEALDVHTQAGQLAGKTMSDWYADARHITPEVEGRDLSWSDQLAEILLRLDPPQK